MSNIPIYINNFNRLSTTKKLVEDLQKLGYQNITILDNQSSYPPLLEWYDSDPCRIIHLARNMQSYALWDCGEFKNVAEEPWIVYSDSDIELNPNAPPDFVNILIEKADKYNFTKAGLALSIENLPDNSYANFYKDWEAKFWHNELEPNVFDAQVDTTFCIVKPHSTIQYKALRVAGNFTAKHVPWYVQWDNLDDEEKYYLAHAENYSTYKRFYLENIKNQ